MKELLICCVILVSCPLLSQEKKKDKDMPSGNANYAKKNFADAEADYRISASANPDKMASVFNLGNSIYRQKQMAESKLQYEKVAKSGTSHFEKHRAFHNLGNIYMAEKKYSQAVESYKNALRNNPEDEQTRYNYALAKKLLKKNPPPKNDKNKDKKDDKPQPKQNKPDQKPKPDHGKGDDPDKNRGQNDPKDGGQNENQKPRPAPGGISRQRLESMLKAVDNEEKKVQEKVNTKKEKAPPVQTEKDW